MRTALSITILHLVFITVCGSKVGSRLSLPMSWSKPPLSSVSVFGRRVFVLRDDSIRSSISRISGNKVRKFKFLEQRLLPGSNILSYGGSQSNALLALSKIAASTASKLHYFTRHIPLELKKKPVGNYRASIDLGTKFMEVDKEVFKSITDWSESGAIQSRTPFILREYRSQIAGDSTQWVRQGGADAEAALGVEELAAEMVTHIREVATSGPWKVVVASGTGTTAYFLARYFASIQEQTITPASDLGAKSPLDIEVLTAPCVGTAEHLHSQMQQLHTLCGGGAYHGPTILWTDRAPRRVFAKPCAEHFAIWRALREETGIDFDLIYAPRTFEILLSQCGLYADHPSTRSLKDWLPGANILYYHCGGVEGNESQLLRYSKLTEQS